MLQTTYDTRSFVVVPFYLIWRHKNFLKKIGLISSEAEIIKVLCCKQAKPKIKLHNIIMLFPQKKIFLLSK